jgi:hypothetical protein
MNARALNLAEVTVDLFESRACETFRAHPDEFPDAPEFRLQLDQVKRLSAPVSGRRQPFSLLFTADIDVDAPVHALVSIQGNGIALEGVFLSRVSVVGSSTQQSCAWFEVIFT